MNQTVPPYKALREVTGLSQRAVERALGWDQNHRGRLSVIERGIAPTDEERQALLTFYNLWLSGELAKGA